MLPNMGSQEGDWFRNDDRSQENWKPLELRSLRPVLFFFASHLCSMWVCVLIGNPLEIVWEAFEHLLLRTAPTEGL